MSGRHLIPVSLRWGDEDRYGHVNNVVFFRLLEEARARWITESQPDDNLLTHGLLVHQAALTYHAPLHYRIQPVWVEIEVAKVGGASVDLDCRILDHESTESTCFASGRIRLVAYEFSSSRPRRWTGEEKKWLQI